MPLWGRLLGFAHLLFNRAAKNFLLATKKQLHYRGLSSVARIVRKENGAEM